MVLPCKTASCLVLAKLSHETRDESVAAIVIYAARNPITDCSATCRNPSEGLLTDSMKILPCKCHMLLLLLHCHDGAMTIEKGCTTGRETSPGKTELCQNESSALLQAPRPHRSHSHFCSTKLKQLNRAQQKPIIFAVFRSERALMARGISS